MVKGPDVEFGSFASMLACLLHLRLEGGRRCYLDRQRLAARLSVRLSAFAAPTSWIARLRADLREAR
jgi:hypothetical protein